MKSIHQSIHQHLQENNPVILASVIASRGPTPRKAGAKMVLFQNGDSLGSVGGGALEAAVEKFAKSLWSQKGAMLKLFNLDNERAGSLGMICGGEQEILLTLVVPDDTHRAVFQQLAEPENRREKKHLITCLKGRGPHFENVQLGLMESSGNIIGLNLPENIQSELNRLTQGHSMPLLKHFENYTCLMEKDYSQGITYIFGAGHVSRPTLAIASMVGFQTIVLDDRPEFANVKYFPQADQVIVLPDFKDIFAEIDITSDAYLVIVTRGHAHDLTVLEQALKTPAAYIGMIGSKRKTRHCFQSLRDKGINADELARVHAPIGLDIQSETPEEIAVSIVAEMIQVRAARM